MTFAGSGDSDLRLASGMMTFVIVSLWVQVTLCVDRMIQRAVGRVGWFASQALDYFVALTRQGLG